MVTTAGIMVAAYAWAREPASWRDWFRARKPERLAGSWLNTLTTFCPAVISSM